MVSEKSSGMAEFPFEAEESAWWPSQEDRLADELERRAAAGQLTRGSVARRAALPTTTIRLAPQDIALARAQAERKGLRYQTYLKMLLHEALLANEPPHRT